MSESSLAGEIRAGLDRSRAVELGREQGLGHPWVLASTALATLIDALASLLAYLVVWIDSSIGWVFDMALVPVALVLAVPYFGRAVAWVLALVQTLVWTAAALPDAVLAGLGIMPEKRLRVCVQLAPGASEATRMEMLQALKVAVQIYRREANVRLVPAIPWFAEGAFAGPTSPADSWLGVGDSDTHRLDVGCALQAVGEDIGRVGGVLAWRALRHHPFGIGRRLLGSGAPLVVFAVGSVAGGRLIGCSLGPLTDYVTVDIGRPGCLAHELGHACNLLHISQTGNVMNPTCGGAHLTRWQVVLVRLSRHVSYL